MVLLVAVGGGRTVGGAVVVTIGNQRRIEIDDAKALIRGYAFGEEEVVVQWRTPELGESPGTLSRRRWGYRSFDCVPASDGPGLEPIDLFVVSGLNVSMNIERYEALNFVKDEVAAAVSETSRGLSFWHLTDEDLAGAQSTPNTDAWWLNRAWWLLMSLPGIKVTITHKVLHHKWPHLFPLLDTSTIGEYEQGAWRSVLSDLTSQASAFDELEGWFRDLALRRGEVPLTRLRIHDILLWTLVTNQQDKCIAAGYALT